MDSLWKNILWRQFGATIDMLENALLTCPSTLWRERLWYNSPERPLPSDFPRDFATFWYLIYHALFWLDLYLTGPSEEGFAPPPPFTLAELDPAGVLPERPYSKDELHAYLLNLRKKCQTTITELTDEKARQPVKFPWSERMSMSFLELQLYNMRHVQEHAAQLSLFLGQRGIPDEALDWVPVAKADEGGE
jgi:hypothetical protein